MPSARNQWPGTVASITLSGSQANYIITLNAALSPTYIVATITSTSGATYTTHATCKALINPCDIYLER